jgi:hypothetical protein
MDSVGNYAIFNVTTPCKLRKLKGRPLRIRKEREEEGGNHGGIHQEEKIGEEGRR